MNTPRMFYVPLEGYRERYTMQWAAPITGWQERNWLAAGVDYVRIDGDASDTPRQIKTGSVVDGIGRSIHCFSQVKKILLMLERGVIKDGDVIYFDDFWHPGIEAIPYACHLLGVKVHMYAFLHAQSVDCYDFTFPMKHWIRGFEKAYADVLDGIFVCCPTLKRLVHMFEGGITSVNDKVHITGHPFNSKEVMERMPASYVNMMNGSPVIGYAAPPPRKNQVVWSSRWDEEKNPWFFLNLAEKMPDVDFVVCTSAPNLRSNQQALLDDLSVTMRKCPNLTLKENLTKEEYYAILCESKIQFNSASQDFVAITLLESSVAGCYPIYPNYRSFPETFQQRPEFMYQHLNLTSAMKMIGEIIDRDDLWTEKEIRSREWIHTRFDDSWIRMLNVMGAPAAKPLTAVPGTMLWSC